MFIYKRNFDQNRHIYFLTKKRKSFYSIYGHSRKSLEYWNIIKNKFNSELIHCKKYLVSFVFKVLKH